MVSKCVILIVLLLPSLTTEAQDCFARVSLDRRSVYVQQPFKVTISVLTATWYTAPLEFDNIQLPNAFVIPFDQTQPGMFDVGYDQYAGLTFYFIVFPYKDGSFTIPPLSIVATTPPKGSSVSRKITIKTNAQAYTVKPLPESMREENITVAKNIFVHEHWNKSLQHVKVGDIIERTISVDARGTLPQFISPVLPDTLPFASVYPHTAELTDTRNDVDANGRYTQTTTYLLEKEGTFIIPAVTVHGWNPLTRKHYTRKAAAKTITVQSNNNLGILTTLRDSLTIQQPVKTIPQKAAGPKKIMGILWYWFFAYLTIGFGILYFLIRWSVQFIRFLRLRHIRYKQTEAYWFRNLMRASDDEYWKRLYQWWDHVGSKNKTTTLREATEAYHNSAWTEMIEHVNEERYGSASTAKEPALKKNAKQFRKWVLTESDETDNTIAETQRKFEM